MRFVLVILSLFCFQETMAANTYRVTKSGGVRQINEHSVCRRVTNNRSLDITIATKTAREWTAFRSKVPSSVSAGYCFYDTNCRREDNSGICQKTYTCPHGEIRRMRMICNLESNSDYSDAIDGKGWNSTTVAGESENGYSCIVGNQSFSSGTGSLSSNSRIGTTSVTYSCEDDDNNGGDCSIFLQVECGD